MDSHQSGGAGYAGSHDLRQQNQHQHQHQEQGRNLAPGSSAVSAVSDPGYQELRNRESLISVNTEDRRTPQPQTTEHSMCHQHYPPPSIANDEGVHSCSSHREWSVPFLEPSNHDYEPVAAVSGNSDGACYVVEPVSDTDAAAGNVGKKKNRFKSFKHRKHYSKIPEESIDLSLLTSAAPMGLAYDYNQSRGPGALDHDYTASTGPAVDLSSFDSGPAMNSAPTESNLRKYQAAEASGHLTGGLGTGWRPEATIRGEDLLALSPAPETNLRRSFSRRRPKLGRRDTLKELGQYEANRRGEVVEVILEDDEQIRTLPAAAPSEVDLSIMTPPATLDQTNPHRAKTIPKNLTERKTEMFFPQPNWKPFSMRWPYLTFLILLSIGLAVAQEVALTWSPLVIFNTPDELGPRYAAVKFLPTIITVAYGVLWQFTDFEVRRLEAFYQMSKPGGALAAESLNVDYITAINFFRPIRALKLKHHAVAISSVATVMSVSLVPTLGAASIFLSPDRETRNEDPDGTKEIRINPVWSRILTVVLCLCAAMAMVLFWLLHKRRTGLKNDVKGIAGLASMAVVSHILMDFRDLDVAPPKDIHARLKYHRYVLRNSSLAPDDENPVSRHEDDKYERAHVSDNPHPLMLRPAGAVPFILWIVALMAFIPLFLFTAAEVVTSRAPWVVTIMAVSIKLLWGSLDTDIRMMEPYYILFNRHAPPKTLCLDYTALPFGWMPIRALLNRHWLVFFVGFGTVMTEVLTILVTSLATVEGRAFIEVRSYHHDGQPRMQLGNEVHDTRDIDSGQETHTSFFISFCLALLILIYLAVVASIVFARRRHPFLPRQPNTISSVLAFIHQSKMLYDFTATEKLNNAETIIRLEGIGKKYGLGWFEGRDGQTHCGVDQEELSGNYRHGMNYENINKPWVGNWDRWEE